MYYFEVNLIKSLCLGILGQEKKAGYTLDYFNNFSEKLSQNNRKKLNVYNEFINLIFDKEIKTLTEDENDEDYTVIIFDILEVLLQCKEIDIFTKSLQLLNLINDKTVLLKLGKLYYKKDLRNFAKNELVRSIKLFDMIDSSGLEILMETLY